MWIKISKQKLESYKRAEALAQEFRHQVTKPGGPNLQAIFTRCEAWLKVAGSKIAYKIPEGQVWRHIRLVTDAANLVQINMIVLT